MAMPSLPGASAKLSRYGAVQVTTCSPGQLLVMLYDGLFRFLREAQAALETKDFARAGERVNRSHAIIEQLLIGLDPSAAPELVEQLQPLYWYCMTRIIEANVQRDPAKIADVIRILEPLRDAWKTAVASLANGDTSAKK